MAQCMVMRKFAFILPLLLVLSSAGAESPFAIRGIKGLWWGGTDNYRAALPWVADHGMNFLMFCYSSYPASGKDWRSEYTPQQLADFHELSAIAEKRHVELCLSFNPGIWSKPPLTYSSEGDFVIAWNKVKTVHATGIHSFALCLDDINTRLQPDDAARFGTLEKCQTYFVNRLWKQMQTLSPKPRLIFCPSAYTTGEMQKHLAYTRTIGAEIDAGVDMFWTGPTVCSATITKSDAEKVTAWLHRKPIVWDNYPVNDMFPWRPLLAPVKGRSPDLGDAVAGLMANPMKQWHASTLPLATLADYLADPIQYDSQKSGEALVASYPLSQQPAIRDLLNLYGRTFLGENGYPPKPADKAALAKLRDELTNLPELANLWHDIQPTLESDLKQ
jgi:hyaluronoglucosaminidase